MKKAQLALLLCATMGLGFSACDDDDDDDAYSATDPRVKVMAIDGMSCTFIVNDAEGKIYNYDSLSFGTDIDSLSVSFYGYDATPTIEYLKDGEWTTFYNKSDSSQLLDFRNLKIRTTSENGDNVKEYTIDLRVHQYDVNSFIWKEIAELPLTGTVKSERGIAKNGIYYFFYTNTDGESYALKSEDYGASWKSTKLDFTSDWTSVLYNGAKFVAVSADGTTTAFDTLYKKSDIDVDGVTIKHGLFALNNKFWFIGTADGKEYIANATDGKVKELPSNFTYENISAAANKSGSTQLGYIYTTKDSTSKLWALDSNGNMITLSSNNNGLPILTEPALTFIDSELGLIGGKTTKGEYSKIFYGSSDGGINWSADWHKELPGEIGGLSNIFAAVNGNNLILMGGRNADGYVPYVWRGSLKTITTK